MINYLIAALFILTIALTSGSILITTHLRSSYKTEFFSALLFYQVFYFTFGFYAIWGQFIVTSFLTSFVSVELIGRIKDLTVLLGLPFLALGLLMFVRFSREVSGKSTSRFFFLWFLILNTILIFGIGYIFIKYQQIDTFLVVKFYYITFSLLLTFYGVYVMLFGKHQINRLKNFDLKNLSIGIFSFLIAQSIILILYADSIYIALLFILVFFISGTYIPIYFRYYADLSTLLPKGELSNSFEQFCREHEISKRETEIIYEICNGLTNQQIADKLFISLQTVKDHTHRIYFKTDCPNRAQLMRMVNESS
jgi:DNA-binding CsgD family transcriptional regulator